MLWRLSLFLGARCQLNNKVNFLLLSIPDKSPKFILLWRYTSSYSFLHRASKHADLIGKSRTQLPTNAIKATNKATLDYEVGLWHDHSLGAFYGSLVNQKMPHHIHHRNKGLYFSKLKCVFEKPWPFSGSVVHPNNHVVAWLHSFSWHSL